VDQDKLDEILADQAGTQRSAQPRQEELEAARHGIDGDHIINNQPIQDEAVVLEDDEDEVSAPELQ